MSVWLWVLTVSPLVLLILMYSKIRVHLYYSRAKENDRFFLGLQIAYGLLRYRYEIPAMKLKGLLEGVQMKTETVNDKQSDLKEESRENVTPDRISEYFQQVRKAVRSIPNLGEWTKRSLSILHCTDLKWETRIGLGDAVGTGVATGFVWSVKSSFLGFVFQYVRLLAKPRISVTPQFNQTFFTTEFSCVLKLRLGHVLIAAFFLLTQIWKGRRSLKTWKNLASKA